MSRLPLLVLILLSSVLLLNARQINVRDRKIVDKQGREFFIRGTNVVVKVPPYIPTTGAFDPIRSFGPEDIKILKDNGFNAIRLGMMWAGVQPKKDWYNQTYLDEMVKIVNSAGQAGIYTLIDYHQDILSEKFCGDGVPIWLMDELNSYKSFPFPMGKKIHLNDSGLPDWNDCDKGNWGKYYFSYDVGQGFNDLYNPNHKLNHKFNDYWRKVAQTFKGNPYVIAYELINEPWAGNFWRNPTLVIPSMGQRLKLQNFYDKLSQTIRSVDQQTPLCFEPVTFDNLVPTGFSHPPGGNKFRNQSIFCFHHYHPPAMSLGSINAYVRDGRKLKVATLLSETSGGPGVFQRAQKLKQGWMYWEYKDFGKNWGSSQQDKSAKRLHEILSSDSNDIIALGYIRTFFVRIAGSLDQSNYDENTFAFSATYFGIPNGETVLFMQRQKVYGNSYMVNIYPESEVQVREEGNYITIKYTGMEINKKILVSVTKL